MYESQRDFILLNVQTSEPQCKRPRQGGDNGVRANSKKYFFTKDGGKKIQVCYHFLEDLMYF